MELPAILGGAPVREDKIYYGRQWVTEEDIDAVDDILTEQVDVQSLVNDGEKSVELVLPENINLRDGVTSVTIKYSSAE